MDLASINLSIDKSLSVSCQLSSLNAVAIIDDVIATGGTAEASIKLIKDSGAKIYEFVSAIDLPFLGGSERIATHNVPVRSVISYDS